MLKKHFLLLLMLTTVVLLNIFVKIIIFSGLFDEFKFKMNNIIYSSICLEHYKSLSQFNASLLK